MSKEDKNKEVFVAYEDSIPWDPSTPEKNLLRAMLITAMADFNKNGEVGRQAKDFFTSPETDYIFSFHSICDYLGIDPKSVRAKLGLLKNVVNDNKATFR